MRYALTDCDRCGLGTQTQAGERPKCTSIVIDDWVAEGPPGEGVKLRQRVIDLCPQCSALFEKFLFEKNIGIL